MEQSKEEFKRDLCDAISHDRDVQKVLLDVIKRSVISNPEIRAILGQSCVSDSGHKP